MARKNLLNSRARRHGGSLPLVGSRCWNCISVYRTPSATIKRGHQAPRLADGDHLVTDIVQKCEQRCTKAREVVDGRKTRQAFLHGSRQAFQGSGGLIGGGYGQQCMDRSRLR